MIYLGIIFACILLFTIIYAFSKNKKPFKRAFMSMLLGLVSLVIINIIGKFAGINLPISPFSITVSACGGLPAVAAMVLINTFI